LEKPKSEGDAVKSEDDAVKGLQGNLGNLNRVTAEGEGDVAGADEPSVAEGTHLQAGEREEVATAAESDKPREERADGGPPREERADGEPPEGERPTPPPGAQVQTPQPTTENGKAALRALVIYVAPEGDARAEFFHKSLENVIRSGDTAVPGIEAPIFTALYAKQISVPSDKPAPVPEQLEQQEGGASFLGFGDSYDKFDTVLQKYEKDGIDQEHSPSIIDLDDGKRTILTVFYLFHAVCATHSVDRASYFKSMGSVYDAFKDAYKMRIGVATIKGETFIAYHENLDIAVQQADGDVKFVKWEQLFKDGAAKALIIKIKVAGDEQIKKPETWTGKLKKIF
jgi:hypothetical protein